METTSRSCPARAVEFRGNVSPGPKRLPELLVVATELLGSGDYTYPSEFDNGLTLILDAIQAQLDATRDA